ncbi:MAG: hypothetical protein ACRDTE_05445 [Pseudonocardiaceae bacterium]
MDSGLGGESGPAAAPWVHRSWCAPECGFAPGGVEGTHLGVAWTLPRAEGETGGLELRLFEQVGEAEVGVVRVLLSVTERRLVDDLDPLAGLREVSGPVPVGGLADIASSAELSAEEAGWVFEELVAFARCARELSAGGDRGTNRIS